jgi:ribosomal protein L12E/L44/L45/RPP1/RPP2
VKKFHHDLCSFNLKEVVSTAAEAAAAAAAAASFHHYLQKESTLHPILKVQSW